ncbi:MAG: S46 family peptidase [bacterium]|nr:S46 family peptidase [bacterium]
MLKLIKTLLLVMLTVSFVSVSIADEGMWMPHQMKDLDLKNKGLEMDPGDLYKKDGTGLMSAVVQFPGGTAEFVSSEGLMLTNHHVAFRAIQRASDKEHDYLMNGFLAKTKSAEIQAVGYTADVLLGYEDVTAAVNKVLKPRMNSQKRRDAIDGISKKLIAKAEKKGKDLRCNFKTMYSGNQYYLFTFKRLQDVRLVYAPPMALGNFGGNIDNWMWPRHTCDFSFLRAYVSKDNRGVAYSKDNVPYRPRSVIKISLEGLKDGDFTFLMGYAGRTSRNFTTSEYRYDLEDMKQTVIFYQGLIDFLESAGKDNRAIQIKYASKIKRLKNTAKNQRGKLEGLDKRGVMARKQALEKKLMQWVEQDPKRKKKYGGILEKIKTFMVENTSFYQKEDQVSALVDDRLGPALLSQAYTIFRTVDESRKPDFKREADYQSRNLPDIRTEVQATERSYEFETDRAYFKYLLKNFLKLDKSSYPRALAPVLEAGEAGFDSYVDGLYDKTILKDPKKRLELLTYKPRALLKLNDPLIKLAAALEKELKVLREKMNSVNQAKDDLKKIYLAAMLEMREGKLAPDANASIRFTYGPVKGYSPKDAVTYIPFTTLTGIMEKDTGIRPFDVPRKLKSLYKTKDFGRYKDKDTGDIVTCFLNTTNVTGGNSGSPILNARGEQVGIVFDMTYESVIGDYYIIPELQRSISVDIRYVLFIAEKCSGAHHLIIEMGL